MITKWEDIPGVRKVYWGSFDTVVLVTKDDFVAVSAIRGHDEEVYPVLATQDNEDALYDAVQAGAPGAQELLNAARAKFKQGLEEQELRRLAYLQKKHGGVK